jgi:hypothetical protein
MPVTIRVVALVLVGAVGVLLPLANLRVASAGGQENLRETPPDATPFRLGNMTFYNGAAPKARLLARINLNRKLTPDEYREVATVRFAPGSERFPNGVVAEGMYVTALQPDGSTASWDRTGNLVSRATGGWGGGLKDGEVEFHIERLKLPNMPELIDKASFDRMTRTRAIESELGVVGGSAGYFSQPTASAYGGEYFGFSELYRWAPRRPVPAEVDVYLTTSYGPWQTVGESRRNPTGTARLAVPGGGTALLSPLATRRNGVYAEVSARIPARFTAQDPNGRPLWNLRLEPVDAAGRPVGKPRVAQYILAPDASPANTEARILFRFITSELPFEKVTSARILARPMQTVYFRNVPTKPNEIPEAPAKSR